MNFANRIRPLDKSRRNTKKFENCYPTPNIITPYKSLNVSEMGWLFTENDATIQIIHISVGTVHLKWDSCEPLHRKVEVGIIDDDQDMQHFFKNSQWHQQIIWSSCGSPWVSISTWTRWSPPLSPFIILHSNYFLRDEIIGQILSSSSSSFGLNSSMSTLHPLFYSQACFSK